MQILTLINMAFLESNETMFKLDGTHFYMKTKT
jgi:hypothetical protein